MWPQYYMGHEDTRREGHDIGRPFSDHDDRASRREVEGIEDPRRPGTDAAPCGLRAGDPRLSGDAAPRGASVMAKTILQVEPGLYRRLTKAGTWGAKLWYTTVVDGQTVFRSTKTADLRDARKVRALAVAAVENGTPQPKARLLVSHVLDGLLENYETNHLRSLQTARGHVKALTAAIGNIPAGKLKTKRIVAMQRAWPQAGTVTNVTINRRCETLLHAFNLAVRGGELAVAPYVPRLKAQSILGKYLPGGVQAVLAEHLPTHVVTLMEVGRLIGTRRGQLSRTERTWIDPERRVLAWPPDECKNDAPRVIPLDEAAWAIIEQLLAQGAERPWCPYLFHGPRCAPGRAPSKRWGCIGDFRTPWETACKKVGLPVGRKNGGYVFHHLRNTAVTDLLASGKLSAAEAMVISGHKTESMVKHYNMGNLEALRERLEAARLETERMQQRTDAQHAPHALSQKTPLHSVAPARST